MESNLAVLIDFENIAAGAEHGPGGRFDVAALMERITDKGRVLIARSYADWGRFARYKQTLLTSNITMMELTSHGIQNKNRADIALVVDALELAFTRSYIDTFVVVSGDSDFTPLVLKMRELNKRVIGIGLRQATSRLLIQACDEFIFYDTVIRTRPNERLRATPEPVETEQVDIYTLLAEVVQSMERENTVAPLASVVKSAILRKRPDFSETEYGFSTFGKLLDAARERGLISLSRDPKAGSWRVSASSKNEDISEPSTTPAPAPVASPRRRDSDARWNDPRIPQGVVALVEVLSQDGLNPLSNETRLAILQAFTESIHERHRRGRQINLQYLQDDVRKRLRKGFSDVPFEAMRSIFKALVQTGQIVSVDGGPVREQTTPFILADSDPSALNRALAEVYLSAIAESEAELPNVAALTGLLFGGNSPDDIAWVTSTLAMSDSDALLESALLIDEPAAPAPRPLSVQETDDLDALLSME